MKNKYYFRIETIKEDIKDIKSNEWIIYSNYQNNNILKNTTKLNI